MQAPISKDIRELLKDSLSARMLMSRILLGQRSGEDEISFTVGNKTVRLVRVATLSKSR